ncbi:MAG: hypothetical protein ACJ762_09540 [Solirubrobacteraceae bacterium]
MQDDAPLCLLLLDGVLEEVPFRERAEDLKRAPGVLVIEPGRRPPPALLAARVARRLARKLPGTPRLIILIGETQRHLAAVIAAEHKGSELLVAGTDFDPAHPAGVAAFQANAPLWDALEQRGIARR